MVKKISRRSGNSHKKLKKVKVDKPDIIELKIPGLPKYVSVACLSVSNIARQMSFGKNTIEDIKLCVSEACTNAVKHAYKKKSISNMIVIRAGIYPDKLDIVVTDTGQGFDSKKIMAYQKNAMTAKTDESLGQGIFLIKRLMDEVKILSQNKKGTQVRMTKKLAN